MRIIGLISYQMSLKYVTGISPAMVLKKQSMDITIYLEGFPTVFDRFEKKGGVLRLKVKIIEII